MCLVSFLFVFSRGGAMGRGRFIKSGWGRSRPPRQTGGEVDRAQVKLASSVDMILAHCQTTTKRQRAVRSKLSAPPLGAIDLAIAEP
mmetsp:Transcript_32023/g.65126  ORF Transcript_32023/g.65126 Transcript_32023/m.65126 type:complete len:87 (+) Transcript_32023:1604-1864(+)